MQRSNSQSSSTPSGNVQPRSVRRSIDSIASQDFKKSQSRRGSAASNLSLNHESTRSTARVSSIAGSGQAASPTGRRTSTPSLANRRTSQGSIAASTSSRSSRGSQSSRPPLSKRNSNVSTASSASSSSFEAYVSPTNANELRAHIARLLPVLTELKAEAAKLISPTTRPSSRPGTPSGTSPYISAEEFNGAKDELAEAIDEHMKACRSLLADLNENGFSKAMAAKFDSLEDESWNLSWIYRGLLNVNSREGQYFLAAGLNML